MHQSISFGSAWNCLPGNKKARCPEPDSAREAYQRFLQEGQALQIRTLRESSGLSRKGFAAGTGIPLSSLRAWEDGKKTVSYKSWERYFKGMRAAGQDDNGKLSNESSQTA